MISCAFILCICRFTFSDKYIGGDGILLNMYVFSFIRNHHTIYHGSHAIFFYSFHSGRKLPLLHILHTRPYYHIFSYEDSYFRWREIGRKRSISVLLLRWNFVLDSQTHYPNLRLRNSPMFVPLINITVLQHKQDLIDSLLFHMK